MKKTEKLTCAMFAVANSEELCTGTKLEVLETLFKEREFAEYSEKREEGAKCSET